MFHALYTKYYFNTIITKEEASTLTDRHIQPHGIRSRRPKGDVWSSSETEKSSQ